MMMMIEMHAKLSFLPAVGKHFILCADVWNDAIMYTISHIVFSPIKVTPPYHEIITDN